MSRPFSMFAESVPSKVCTACRAAFYTEVGLAEHVRAGCSNGPVVAVSRRWTTGYFSPAGFAVQQAKGRQLAAENNARRRRCDGCGHVSTPAGIGIHQKATGHSGWTPA